METGMRGDTGSELTGHDQPRRLRELLQQITDDLKTIARDEVELVRLEVADLEAPVGHAKRIVYSVRERLHLAGLAQRRRHMRDRESIEHEIEERREELVSGVGEV